MRILIVTQYFWPENFRINDLALELKKRKHDITVLTGLPNYPMGKYFNGYTIEKNCDEMWNEIPIYRCKLKARKLGTINMVKNYISFVIQAKKKSKDILPQDFDIIYVFEVSPITVALPAIYIKKKKNIPIIMNVQDLWPENIVAVTGIHNSLIIGFINRIVNYIYKRCDLILTASKSFVPIIQSRIDEKNKVIFWPQYATVSKQVKNEILFSEDYFNIAFTGNIGNAQGLNIAIEAAEILKNTKIRWHLIGDGREMDSLKKVVRDKSLEDIVIFHGRLPEEKMPQYLANADAALLILKPNPIFEMTLPAKLQTYMACGMPIIGCVSGEGKRTIEEAKCGIVSKVISVNALVEVCKVYLSLPEDDINELSLNSLRYSKMNFDKEKLIRELIEKMEELIK